MRPVLTAVLVLMFTLPTAGIGRLADRVAPGSIPVLVHGDGAVLTPMKRGAEIAKTARDVSTVCVGPKHLTCSPQGMERLHDTPSGVTMSGASAPNDWASPATARRKRGKKGKRTRTPRVMIA